MNVQKLKGIIKVKMQDKRGIKKTHYSSTTSLLHRYHADDLSLYIKSNFLGTGADHPVSHKAT